MAKLDKKGYLDGLRAGVPIGLGYLSVSFAFGIAAVSKGIPPLIALFISMTNVTSAGQLAGLGIMTGSGNYIELVISQIVINLRYALMSVSLSQKLDGSIGMLDRLLISFCNTDEVFAVASGRQGDVGKRFMYGLITAPYLGWSLGTLLGAIASGILPETAMSALGIAIYGMFIAIIIPPSRKSKAVALVCVISSVLSCIFDIFPGILRISGGFVIIICAVVASVLGSILFPINIDEEAEE